MLPLKLEKVSKVYQEDFKNLEIWKAQLNKSLSYYFFDSENLSFIRSENSLNWKESAKAYTTYRKTLKPLEKSKSNYSILHISLNVAQSCNMNCDYCYAGSGEFSNKGYMSFNVAKAAIDRFARGKKNFAITFIGGEPLLNLKLIKEVVSYSKSFTNTQFKFLIVTNGTLLQKSTLDFLKAEKFHITVSYDGHGIQNKQRKLKGSYEKSQDRVEAKLLHLESELAKYPDFKIRATLGKRGFKRFI